MPFQGMPQSRWFIKLVNRKKNPTLAIHFIGQKLKMAWYALKKTDALSKTKSKKIT